MNILINYLTTSDHEKYKQIQIRKKTYIFIIIMHVTDRIQMNQRSIPVTKSNQNKVDPMKTKINIEITDLNPVKSEIRNPLIALHSTKEISSCNETKTESVPIIPESVFQAFTKKTLIKNPKKEN
jgi:hypothetical protein